MNDQRRYVLIGLGAYGTEIARTLLEHDADIIVMDRDPGTVNRMKSEGCKFAVHIDNLDPLALAKFIKPDDTVILSMGDAFEEQILTIELLKGIGVRTIYARATKDIQNRILEKMEITDILFPEKHEGKRFALKLLNRNFHFIDEFASDIFLIEVPVNEKFEGKSIIEHQIRTKYNVNIIGLKSKIHENGDKQSIKMEYVGFEKAILKSGDSLLVIGKEGDLEDLVGETQKE
jgi:trk system potassium uptake protein TrkA